jgi:hypothetical protein
MYVSQDSSVSKVTCFSSPRREYWAHPMGIGVGGVYRGGKAVGG